MGKIQVLDQDIANKIAAGEVIERPLSAVKELVENALDAGATKITVEIKDGGTTVIIVSDDGQGIEAASVPVAFLRHATSKINRVEDLNDITTLGFRGEALPSIAAVSRVTILTRTGDQDAGMKLALAGGEIITNTPAGCQLGTTITVQDLFYNIPVRKKHLKGAAAEAGLINDLLSRLALSRPDVSFKLVSQKQLVLETPGNGKLLETFAAVNSVQVARKMLLVEGEAGGIHIYGYVSKPELSRATRLQQTFLINGRYVKSKLVAAALQEAYHTLLSSRRYPLAVLRIKMPPGMVDVNVHPAKTEVRISTERELYKLVVATVKKSLHTLQSVPLLEPPLPKYQPQAAVQPDYAPKTAPQPVQAKLAFNTQPVDSETAIQKQPEPALFSTKLMRTFRQVPATKEEGAVCPLSSKPVINETSVDYDPNAFPELWSLGQLLPTYILAQAVGGLYVIDQHAAHERVLYEQYTKNMATQHASQMLLVPVVLELKHRETEILTEHILVFKKLGFILEYFGETTYMLRGTPAEFPPGEEAQFFFDVLDNQTGVGSDHFFDKLAADLACRSAIKSGQKLAHSEMEALINQMSKLENPYSCPHGRPTMINLSFAELDKKFKR
ncbi:DNA mismatch repair endonuclease MutL [Peptococcaceae bacterium]|nr:DNA mismatch repair endonuclease MutL [Peptococcaceae bacterium]